MKQLFITISIIGGLVINLHAGLITRTYPYTSGNTITANENNTNETTLYTEINGNIESANIKDGTIVNADIADTTIDVAKFTSAVQSTFTYIFQLGAYRRPQLNWFSITTVDVSTNSSTANTTCVAFPTDIRCVTENVLSTSVNRRFIITEVASFSGTKNSGLAPGETESGDTWYAIYAVKVTDVSTDFVLAGTTNTPTQSNYSRLNTLFGTNAWVYLGMIRNGSDGGTTTDIVQFTMSGNTTHFIGSNNGGSVGIVTNGLRFADTGGATTLTYTYASGTGNAVIPSHLSICQYISEWATTATSKVEQDSGGARAYSQGDSINAVVLRMGWRPCSEGVKLSNGGGASIAYDISLGGFVDDVLGVGYNPQL